MHASLYLALLAVAYFYMSFEVIKARRLSKEAYGFGDGKSILAGHAAAHNNFASYTPIFIILLIMAENSWHLPYWAVHLAGSLFFLGRLIHFTGLSKKEHEDPPNFNFRVRGMMLTFFPILALALFILTSYLYRLI